MSLPEWVEPMAATLTQERFSGPQWLFERKFDGIRLLAFKDGANVRLLSRNRLPQSIPSIAQAVANLRVAYRPDICVFDLDPSDDEPATVAGSADSAASPAVAPP